MAKFAALGFVGLLLLVVLSSIIFEKVYPYPDRVSYGVTFSPGYARFLHLDWQRIYLRMLSELGVKNLRLPSYWNILEPRENEYDFSEINFMLDEANKANAKVILVLGIRQPRWPECHIPSWAKSLSVKDRQQKVLEFVRQVVERYKDYPSIQAWQVENEPFLPFFGEGCDWADANFLKKEVSLVRSLSNKNIVISDSGELGLWIVPMQQSDIFGSTLYRDVYNPLLGYLSYPVLPYMYNLKSRIVKLIAPRSQKTIIIELQAEPWFSSGNLAQDFPRQAKMFSVEKIKSYVNYADKTGFDEIYLWGVEWWYLMADKGYPQYLEYARTLFK